MLDSNATCEKYGYNLTTATVVTNSSRIILQEILSLQPYDSHLDAFWTGIYQQGKQVNKLWLFLSLIFPNKLIKWKWGIIESEMKVKVDQKRNCSESGREVKTKLIVFCVVESSGIFGRYSNCVNLFWDFTGMC